MHRPPCYGDWDRKDGITNERLSVQNEYSNKVTISICYFQSVRDTSRMQWPLPHVVPQGSLVAVVVLWGYFADLAFYPTAPDVAAVTALQARHLQSTVASTTAKGSAARFTVSQATIAPPRNRKSILKLHSNHIEIRTLCQNGMLLYCHPHPTGIKNISKSDQPPGPIPAVCSSYE